MYSVGDKTFKHELFGLLAFRSLKRNNQSAKYNYVIPEAKINIEITEENKEKMCVNYRTEKATALNIISK